MTWEGGRHDLVLEEIKYSPTVPLSWIGWWGDCSCGWRCRLNTAADAIDRHAQHTRTAAP
jgi:hypothetical protein